MCMLTHTCMHTLRHSHMHVRTYTHPKHHTHTHTHTHTHSHTLLTYLIDGQRCHEVPGNQLSFWLLFPYTHTHTHTQMWMSARGEGCVWMAAVRTSQGRTAASAMRASCLRPTARAAVVSVTHWWHHRHYWNLTACLWFCWWLFLGHFSSFACPFQDTCVVTVVIDYRIYK